MLKLTYSLHFAAEAAESSMGYQVVGSQPKRTRRSAASFTTLNCCSLKKKPRQVMLLPLTHLLERAENSLFAVKDIRVIPKLAQQSAFAALREAGRCMEPNRKRREAPVERTKSGEVFKRFSAYENDRRVTANGGLLPGTYATTEEDAKNVKTGKEAVARYALPNPKPAVYVFTVKPPKDTDLQRGTVQPAYDQPGGGVEVIFTSGSPEDRHRPDKIPEG